MEKVNGQDTEVIVTTGTDGAAEEAKIESPFEDGTSLDAGAEAGTEQKPKVEKEEKQETEVIVEEEGKPEEKPEEKPETPEGKKERSETIPRERFDQVNEENKKLKAKESEREKRLKALEDNSYIQAREARKQKLLDEGHSELEVENSLKVDDLERKNKILENQVLNGAGSGEKNEPEMDAVLDGFGSKLNETDKSHFDIVKAEMKAKLLQVSPEARTDPAVMNVAFKAAIGENISKFTKQSSQKGKHIADLSAGGSKSSKGAVQVKVKLSASEVEYCSQQGITKEDYAKTKLSNPGYITPEQSVN